MKRIISLVPSLTETVAILADPKELIGITGFCTHPRRVMKHATVIGGTKDPDLELISRLNPTHVLANLEENSTDTLKWLSDRYPILITTPSAVAHVAKMLDDMTNFLDDEAFAKAGSEIDMMIKDLNKPDKLKEAYYFIWKNPWMIAGEDTYIKDVMGFLGFDLIQPVAGRYPEVSFEFLSHSIPKFFATEPWCFRKRDIEILPAEFKKPELCYRIDGKFISWYGISTLELLRKIKSEQIFGIYRHF